MSAPINREQAHALAAFIATLRADWQQPGIVKALSDARTMGTAGELARAAIACAENPKIRTPAVIARAGEHWALSREPGTRIPPRRHPCPDHPDEDDDLCPHHTTTTPARCPEHPDQRAFDCPKHERT